MIARPRIHATGGFFRATLPAFALLALLAGAVAGRAFGDEPDPFDPLSGITAAEARAKIAALTADEMAGRRAGTDGARLAAEYCAKVFEAAGLAPGGDGGGWFQRVEVPPAILPGPGNRLVVKGESRAFALLPLEDFAPFGFSPEARADAPVVFAGYGLTLEDWDDYAGLDVRGKIVLAFRHGPGWTRPTGERPHPWTGAGPEYTFFAKAMAAQERGAAGLILVTDPASAGEEDPLAFLGGGRAPGIRIPCVHAAARLGEALLRLAGSGLKTRQDEMARDGRPLPVAIPGIRVELATSVVRGRTECANVVGVRRGRDDSLASECVVLGGHYDHLGYGDIGARGGGPGKIFPGADDNASGTVGVLEAAEAFGSVPVRPRRSVVFVCFAGEEAGLLGSKAYAENPLFPLSKTVAMVNLDMIGRGKGNRLSVSGVGTAAVLEALVSEANAETGFELNLVKASFGGSDHAPFQARGVPVLFFCAGGNPDYHKPTDTAEKIRYEPLARAAQLAYLVSARLASGEARPVFTAPKRGGGGGGGGKGVRLGFFPDDWYDGRGARMETVLSDTPASRAGLRDGDIVVEFGGARVESIGAFRKMLDETEKGATVELVYVRAGEVRKASVRFD